MARHGRAFPLRWRRPGLATYAQLAVTGTVDITTAAAALEASGSLTFTGTASLSSAAASLSASGTLVYTGTGALTSAAASLAGTGEETFAATGSFTSAAASLSGTGEETFAGTASVTSASASLSASGTQEIVGTGDLTTGAASLQADGTEVVSGTASLTTAAAILVGTGDEIVAGYGDLDSAASSLDISGELSYNGTAAWTSAAASLNGAGTSGVTITGTGAFTSAPAILHAKGRRRRPAGHDLVDLARYNEFVAKGEQILEELGLPPAGTGATDPVVDPVPTLEIQPADYRQFLATALERARQQATPLTVPSLRVTGKAWVKGRATQTAPAAWLIGTGTHQFVFQLEAAGVPAALAATGAVDNYYTIRRQDDALIEQFILEQLYGATAA